MAQKTIPTEKARQGRWGWQVLVVLVVALILAMIAWYGAELFVGPPQEPAPAAQQQEQPPAQTP